MVIKLGASTSGWPRLFSSSLILRLWTVAVASAAVLLSHTYVARAQTPDATAAPSATERPSPTKTPTPSPADLKLADSFAKDGSLKRLSAHIGR